MGNYKYNNYQWGFLKPCWSWSLSGSGLWTGRDSSEARAVQILATCFCQDDTICFELLGAQYPRMYMESSCTSISAASIPGTVAPAASDTMDTLPYEPGEPVPMSQEPIEIEANRGEKNINQSFAVRVILKKTCASVPQGRHFSK